MPGGGAASVGGAAGGNAAGAEQGQTDKALESMSYLLEGVIGSTS